jgi:hypothetical protein
LANLIIQQEVNRVPSGTVTSCFSGTPLPSILKKTIQRQDSRPGASNYHLELERTPGTVAVSGINSRELAGGINSPAGIPETNPSLDQPVKHSCGTYSLISECESGNHHFAKRIYCGKEWCPICGEKRSPAHNRRIARVLPKAMQIREMGYFVIEFPDMYRHLGAGGMSPDEINGRAWCYSKKDLQDTTRRIVDTLAGKRMGRRGRVGGFFSRGLLRWHWFGDEVTGKWNPHANVLVDSSFIENEKLEAIKATLRQALNVPDLIVHYSFYDKPGQMFQKVEYITRATFRDYDWNPYMANELFNFRNQRWWGTWKDAPAWGADQLEETDVDGLLDIGKLQGGICPDCGQPLRTLYRSKLDGHEVKWTRPIDSTWLIIWNAHEIAGTGYHRIPESQWTGKDLSPGEYIRLQELEQEAREKPSVSYVAVLARQRMNRIRASKESESWFDDIIEHPECHN